MTITTRTPHIDYETILGWADFFSDRPGTCFLSSCGHQSEPSPRSFLFLCPRRSWIEWDSSLVYPSLDAPFHAEPFSSHSHLPYYGTFSYDMGAPYRSAPNRESPKQPLYALFEASIWIEFCHAKRHSTLYYSLEDIELIKEYFNHDQRLLNRFLDGEKAPGRHASPTPPRQPLQIAHWESEASFCENVEKVRELIRIGDVYQLNISYEVLLHGTAAPMQLFSHLIRNNPSPQSAFLSLSPSLHIVSSSPERLLQRSEGRIFSQPIKGTRPRGATEEEDCARYHELAASPKERSELAMITDLIRNDLYHVSVPGTVAVTSAYAINAYESVFQQSSTIEGVAREDLSPLQALAKVFPGGSITGCPKSRSLLRIHEIERRLRGIYTGSIGYCMNSRQYDWNIAIRTLIVDSVHDTISFSVGGGIVWDSIPYEEWKETLYKAQSLMRACNLSLPE